MNKAAGSEHRAGSTPSTGAQQTRAAPAQPSLADAVSEVFTTQTTDLFLRKLTDFCRALTNARWCGAITADAPERLAWVSGAAPQSLEVDIQQRIKNLFDLPQHCAPLAEGGHLYCRMTSPDGEPIVLIAAIPPRQNMQSALAHERMTFLAALSQATFSSAHDTRFEELAQAVRVLADGSTGDLTPLVDLLALHSGADYAAAAFLRDGSVSGLTISGQNTAHKRAGLPKQIKSDMQATARLRLSSDARVFAPSGKPDTGLILHVEAPTQNLWVLPVLGALFALQQSRPRKTWLSPARLIKGAALMLALVAVALVPLPDGVAVPAVVEATSKRVVTAPVTAVLSRVAIEDGAEAIQDETVLIELDASEIELELVGVRADHAKALLDRESARAVRDAGALRNAELEVQRLSSRIALLDMRLANTVITAPISGLVQATDLKEREGTTVRQGEELMIVADPTDLRLRVSIPETQIGRLASGATGLFRPDYDPSIRIAAQLTLVSPAGLGDTIEKTFPARAVFSAPPTGLRPGLNGVLSVERTFRPLGLIVYSAIRDYVLLRIWL